MILIVLDDIPLVCGQIQSPEIIQLLIRFVFTPKDIHVALMSVVIFMNNCWVTRSTLGKNFTTDFFPFTCLKVELKGTIYNLAFHETAENNHVVFMDYGSVFITGLGCVFFDVLVWFGAYNFPNEFI